MADYKKPRRKVKVDMGTLNKPTYNTFKNLNIPSTANSQRVAPREFWEDEEGNNELDRMMNQSEWEVTDGVGSGEIIGLAESIITTFNATPELIAAGRIISGGVSTSEAFLQAAQGAGKFKGLDPKGFAWSDNPSEKLFYMSENAKEGPLDLNKVAREVRAGLSTGWQGGNQNNPDNEVDYIETGFAESIRSAEFRGINSKEIKGPMQNALSIYGAMTISNDPAKRSVMPPDKISGFGGEFDKKIRDTSAHLGMITRLYLPEGTWKQKNYNLLKNEVITALGKVLPDTISQTGMRMAQKSAGDKSFISWTDALPTASRLKRELSGSTANMIQDPSWTRDDLPRIKSSIKAARDLFNKGKEDSVFQRHNPLMNESRYMLDEMVVAGVDPSHTVLSKEGTRDDGQEFETTSDPRVKLREGMQTLGITHSDLRQPEIANKLRSLLGSGIGSDKGLMIYAETIIKRGQSFNSVINNEMNRRALLNTANINTSINEAIATQNILAREFTHYGRPNKLNNFKNELNKLSDRLDEKFGINQVRDNPINEYNSAFGNFVKPKLSEATAEYDAMMAARKQNPIGAGSSGGASSVYPRTAGARQTAGPLPRKQVGTSSATPEEAQAAWLRNNPNVSILASGDGNNPDGTVNEEQRTKWQFERSKRATSSVLAGLAGELESDTRKVERDLVREGLGLGKSFGGNSNTESGRVLEPTALDWYRRTIDSTTFTPGLVADSRRTGQASTPDAIAGNGRIAVEVKTRNSFIDPNNARDDQLDPLRKYNMQMQHQMYIGGQKEAHLLQVRRNATNKNKLYGANDVDNYRVDKFPRDEELIGRMSPVWNAMGENSAKIAGMPEKDQKAMAKAVEEGNIKSFERISAKHGISMGDAGHVIGKGGGGGKNFFDVYGGRDAAGSWGQAARQGLAHIKGGRGFNAATLITSLVADTLTKNNDDNLDREFKARQSGFDQSTWAKNRNDLRTSQYISSAMAESDIRSVSLAAGGMGIGLTSGAEKMISGSLGLINFGDLNAIRKGTMTHTELFEKVQRRGRARGYGEKEMAAIGDQIGLHSLVAAEKADANAKKTNAGISNLEETTANISEGFANATGGVVGEMASDVSRIANWVTGKKDAEGNSYSAKMPDWYADRKTEKSRVDEIMKLNNPEGGIDWFGFNKFQAQNQARKEAQEIKITLDQNLELQADWKHLKEPKGDGRVNSK